MKIKGTGKKKTCNLCEKKTTVTLHFNLFLKTHMKGFFLIDIQWQIHL